MNKNIKFIDFDLKYSLKERTKKSFFHYTSPEAFLSIIENGTLRFTDCMFLNDLEEYNYVLEVIKTIISELDDEQKKRLLTSVLTNIDKRNETSMLARNRDDKYEFRDGARYFVLSGSANDDSLPLWCYYSKGTGYYGYSIQFDINKLCNQFGESLSKVATEISFGRVIYDEEEQKKILFNSFNKIYEDFQKELDEVKRTGKDYFGDDSSVEQLTFFYAYEIQEFIQNIRLYFKNDGFKHEREYRIVIKTLVGENNRTKYTFVNGLIKPYLEIDCRKAFSSGGIKSVMISPSIEKEMGTKAVKMLLNDYCGQYANKINVNHSKINLRY